jgi:SAM-dependent methyltransferase
MSDWSHGYNVALGYTYGSYREMSPLWLNFATQLGDVEPPSSRKFRYLELGCGQGFGLALLASMYPQGEFVGIDFNPEHIAHARGLSEAAGLKNVRFEEADFLTLAKAWPGEYGRFDYVALHGILSWVSASLRRAITDCINHCLRPGGLVYASYNALPGWLPSLALQHFLSRYQTSYGLTSVPAIREGFAFMQQMKGVNAGLFQTQPFLADRMEATLKSEQAYLVQEYLHENWKCFWFSEVVEELSAAKLGFVGTATLPEAFLPGVLPEPMRNLVTQQADQIFRQEVIDACINQAFRRDIFQRGIHRPWPLRNAERMRQIKLRLINRPAADHQFAFTTSFGTINKNPEEIWLLLNSLSEGVRTVGELHGLAPFAGQSIAHLLQSIALLLNADILGLVNEGYDIKTVMRFNRAVVQAVAAGAPYNHLAAAQTGSGLAVSISAMLLLDALASGVAAQPNPLADALQQRLTALGRSMSNKEGQPLTDPEAIKAELLQAAEKFLAGILPTWKQLGVWA